MNSQNINPKSLKGKDVFNRTLELMDKLTPINESVINSSLEFIKRAPNGLVYTIIRENHKYFIKTTDKNEFKVSELDYIGGLQNKMTESYPSYEEALKHLNMKFQSLNELYGIKSGYNLFEQDAVDTEDSSNEETGVKEKKYKLKLKPEDSKGSEEMANPSAEIPTSEESSASEEPTVSDVPTSPEGESSDMGDSPSGEVGTSLTVGSSDAEDSTVSDVPTSPEGESSDMGEMPSGEGETPSPETEMPSPEEETPETGMGEEDDEDFEDDDEEDPKKYVQKLTGRLGQKLRELPEVDPKLEKYVINSIISALHIEKMDKKDRMDVIRKFKKKKGMESMMKESYNMDEYYGMMSLDGPFNYEKIRGGFDEDNIQSHPKKHKPLRFKKYELDMDEELIGGQKKLDLNKNNRLDAEDFRMLRAKKKKKSSDEQLGAMLGGMAADYVGNKVIDKFSDKLFGNDEGAEITFHGTKDESSESDIKLQNALKRIKKKREMDRKQKMSDMDELFGRNNPDVADPDIDIDEPLTTPKPRIPNPFEGDDDDSLPMPGPKMGGRETADPDIQIDEPLVEPTPRVPDPFGDDDDETSPMPGPKMGKRKMDKELTFESIIKKYRVKK